MIGCREQSVQISLSSYGGGQGKEGISFDMIGSEIRSTLLVNVQFTKY